MNLLALTRSPRAAHLLMAASLVASAGFVVGPFAPGIAYATGGRAGTGLHDGMMPSDSPDAPSPRTATVRPHSLSPATVLPQATAAASAPAPAPLGVDVSGHQHSSTTTIDWSQVAASGQTFAMVKATELYTDGTTNQPVLYTNPYLQSDLDGASAQGLVVGSYAFAHPENSAVAQADDFAAAIGAWPAGNLPPVLDLEETGGLSVPDLVSWTQTFLVRLKADTGVTPMIYSGPTFWANSMGGSTAFTGYPLWEAHYTTNATPYPMGGWSTYKLWQFTSSATVPGITGNVDQDRFNGTLRQLRGIPGAQACGYCLDFNGDAAPDVIARASDGSLVLSAGNGVGGLLGSHTIGSGWLSRDMIENVGDWDGDGSRDIIARDPSSGALWLYRGNGTGAFVSGGIIGSGWNVFRTIIAPGDWNGDGKPDLIGIRPDGAMFLYAGNGAGGFTGYFPQIGSGWQTLDGITGVGDWDGDGHNDLIARDPANGNLWLYSGAGNGGFRSWRIIGNGWGGFTALVGPGDWNGDGHNDILARRADGALILYPGNGSGGFGWSYPQISNGWNGLTIANSGIN